MSKPYSWRQMLDKVMKDGLVSVHTQAPGKIVNYDPATRRADVQPTLQFRREDESGDQIDEILPIVTSCPVVFDGNDDWEIIHGVNAGDACWIEWSEGSLDDWAQEAAEGPQGHAGSGFNRFHYKDAVVRVGTRVRGDRAPCPSTIMRFGAVDGPQVLFDLSTLKLSLRSVNEIEIAAGTRITINAPDVYINGRHVDLSTGDI